MRPPGFWYPDGEAPPWQALALSPLSAIYARATARRVAQKPTYHSDIPIICVGNLNVGGTGKTPTVIALAELLLREGGNPCIVSRGYGGSEAGPTLVDPARHGAAEVGDEPLLMAAFAPVWIARDRAAGVQAAEAQGATAILLDDGYQNPSVAKDFSIVVVDARLGFGNGRVIPSGPLREPVSAGLKRADALLSIGENADQTRFRARWDKVISLPHLSGFLQPLETGMSWKGLPVLAFAGIGHPEKFFATLRGLGADLRRYEALSDHQPLTPTLMRRLEIEAKALSAQLVTTEKDAVRLPSSFRQHVLTLPVRLTFKEPERLQALLEPPLRRN